MAALTTVPASRFESNVYGSRSAAKSAKPIMAPAHWNSLPCHRDPQALLRGDQVVEILGGLVDVQLDPIDRPGEVA